MLVIRRVLPKEALVNEPSPLKLAIWENTPDYRSQCDRMNGELGLIRKKLKDRGFRGSIGEIELGIDGNWEAWMNWDRNLSKMPTKPETAAIEAMLHGATGFWTMAELQRFAGNALDTGLIFEAAMWDLGFRQRSNDRTKWVRKKGETHSSFSYRPLEYEIIDQTIFEALYLPTLEKPNAQMKSGISFELGAGRKDMVFIKLDVSPFWSGSAEQVPDFAKQMATKCHLAIKQPGFSLKGRNITAGDDRYLQIRVIFPGKPMLGVLWPSRVANSTEGIELIDSLVARISEHLGEKQPS